MIAADVVKTLFLKKTLSISKISSAVLCLKLCNTPSLISELVEEGKFSFDDNAMVEYKTQIRQRLERFESSMFVYGPAFQDSSWMLPNQKNRGRLVGYSAHGFHHLMCLSNNFHRPPIDEHNDCVCSNCGGPFVGGVYHLMCCPAFECDDLLFGRIERLLVTTCSKERK